jgi:DNA-binding HxlR family transcriptional regulator
VLTESLRRQQRRGHVARDSEATVPGRSVTAVYRLTPLGESFAQGPLAALARWAADHQDDLVGTDDLLDGDESTPPDPPLQRAPV